jgi:hypothetical protein
MTIKKVEIKQAVVGTCKYTTVGDLRTQRTTTEK